MKRLEAAQIWKTHPLEKFRWLGIMAGKGRNLIFKIVMGLLLRKDMWWVQIL